MEKVLRLYKIPDVGDIVTVIGVGISLPQTGFSAGDLFIDSLNETLYEAQSSGGTLSWVQVSFDSTKYYRDGSKDVPVFYTYSVQDGLEEYDVSFPTNADRRAEITSFTYNATRMGNAPTISGTLMYRDCLDELWDDRVCVFFNKKFYFIDKIPSSEYSNADERYKHSCEFVSENRLLENVYFTNVVDIAHYQGDITKLPMQWLEFSFFGGITEFVKRLNLSLEYSGLDAQHVGFKVVKDTLPTVEEKLISISDTTLKAALDLIYETWEIPYWFDGYTIHIGYSNEQQMQQAGITMPTFQYGAVQSLLSLQKSQSNDIVNRITGFGSSENIPVFYPNKNPNAIEIQYERNQTLMVNYARIANPYKTVSLEPSQPEHQGTPSGSFFKFMPITKTYNYDQFMTVNVHHQPNVTEVDGMPSLYLSAIEDYNSQSRYFEQEYGGTAAVIGHSSAHPQYNIVCKRIWVWLHEGTHTLISFKDEMDAPSMFNTGGANSIIFEETHTPRFFVKAQSYTYTREQYEYMINATQGFTPYASANLIDKYFNLRTTANGVQYVWDNGTVTDTYDEVFPIDLTSLPNNTTCLSFTVGIMSNYNAAYADPAYVMTQLKTETKLVIKHTLLSDPDWSLNADGNVAHLWRYGIRLNANVTPQENDLIYFTRESGALPYFGQLLPYSFRNTNDIWLNAINSHYLKEGSLSAYYTFENLYKISCAKEHVENFDDIKPTIKGMMNNESPAKHIDQILDVTFDQDDNNDLKENGTDYQHPYFFVKLAKTSADDGYSFNLFDCAIEGQTMTLNMADGNCGGCNFEVMVNYQSDGMAINPVGVFEQATTINGVTYAAGTPKRDLSTGRVLTNRNESAQQDTSSQSVWIALKKDNSTFGSSDNGNAVVLPDSARGQNFIPTSGDSFTILNICLPYAYVVAAEKKLYYALLDYMEQNNPRQWSFNIKFSSIYYKKHYEFMDKWLNESSRVPFVYNGITRTYYVQSYNYKVTDAEALPEVTIELTEKVRKLNVYYPMPYNPYAQPANTYDIQQQKALKKIVSDYMFGFSPSDIEAENLHVNGDVTLANGTSLNAQIAALNSQILSNDKVLTAENLWSKVKSGADNTNSFVDGIFATDLNTTTDTDVRITHNQGGAVGDNSLHAVFAGNSSSFTFNQKIAVAENTKHTVAFFAKCATQDDVVVDVTWYDEYDNELDNTKVSVSVGDEWGQHVVPFSTEDDAAYALLAFSYFGEDSDVAVDLDGIAVYPTDYTAQDQDGSSVVNSLLPTNYKMSTADIFNAIDKLGGGGSSSDILVCTFASNIMDKTPQEIYEAKQAGKIVICIYNDTVFYLGSCTYTNDTYTVIFTVIPSGGGIIQFLYIRYYNGAWRSGSVNLQKQLIGSGSGQNIKTINNESLLGSGNISVGDNVLVCTYSNGSVDKTPQEIATAYNNGKVVVCRYPDSLFYCVYASPSMIIFSHCTTGISSSGGAIIGVTDVVTRYIVYLSSVNAWYYSPAKTLQDKLISGTNIKTINSQSLLGSGNISVGDNVFVCTFTPNAGSTVYGTMDKPDTEILAAANAGKVVICVYTSEIYYLFSKNALIFCRILSYQSSYITYDQANSRWEKSSIILQQSLSSGTNIKTINGNSVLGSGNLETENWQTIVADDGDTGTTITPTTDYTVIFIDNSANSSDYTVTIDSTGIYMIFDEYDSLVVEDGNTARFDIRKFTTNNVVYASVKRTDLTVQEQEYFGVTSFRADDVLSCMNGLGLSTIDQYIQAIESPTTDYEKPSVFIKTGTMTFNNETYYTYSLLDWGTYYEPYYIVLIPSTFAFKASKTAGNCEGDMSVTQIPYYYLTSDNMAVYKGSSNAPSVQPRNLIDFVP